MNAFWIVSFMSGKSITIAPVGSGIWLWSSKANMGIGYIRRKSAGISSSGSNFLWGNCSKQIIRSGFFHPSFVL